MHIISEFCAQLVSLQNVITSYMFVVRYDSYAACAILANPSGSFSSWYGRQSFAVLLHANICGPFMSNQRF